MTKRIQLDELRDIEQALEAAIDRMEHIEKYSHVMTPCTAAIALARRALGHVQKLSR